MSLASLTGTRIKAARPITKMLCNYIMIMKFFLRVIFIFVFIYLGWLFNDIRNEFSNIKKVNNHSFSEILPFIDRRISKEKLQSCSELKGNTVGDVLASIIDINNLFKTNRMSFYCMDNSCYITVSSCNKYKQSECGSRILHFNYIGKSIDNSSFECIDTP